MSNDRPDGMPEIVDFDGEKKPLDDGEPQPIIFKATYYPDGKLHVECPLMRNPIMMKGFIEMIKEGVNNILEGKAEENKPRIQPPPGSFLNGLRKRLR